MHDMNIKITFMHIHELVFLLYSVSLIKVSKYILIYVVHIYSFDLYTSSAFTLLQIFVDLKTCNLLCIIVKTYKRVSLLLQMLLSFFFWSTNWVFHITIIKYFLQYLW